MELDLATWNVNGLRSAVRNGMLQAVVDARPDVVLLQELKCDEESARKLLAPLDYDVAIAAGQAGRAGVAVLTRGSHERLDIRLGHDDLDGEGRLVGVRFDGFELWSCYAPSGAGKRERLALKHTFLRGLVEHARARSDEAVLFGGDLNVAHQRLDVEGADEPRPRPGYLPVEREMLTELVTAGWTDLVRAANADASGPFTWRSRTRGWRLDHVWASPGARLRAVAHSLGPATPASDHHLLSVRAVR